VAVDHLPSPPALAKYRSTRAITGAAAALAADVNADAIVVATQHGNAARLMAAHRPPMPIVALTDRPRAVRRTTLLPGVQGCLVKEHNRSRDTVAEAVETLFKDGRLQGGDTVVTVTGSPFAIRGRTSTIRLIEVGDAGQLKMLE